MEIKFDAEAAATIASAAIFDSMSQDARDGVIRSAVQFLLTPEEQRYGGRGSTPLQDAFNEAIQQAAFKAVQEKIANDPVVTQSIADILGPMINAALVAESELWNSGLANAIGSALGSWLAEQARKGS